MSLQTCRKMIKQMKSYSHNEMMIILSDCNTKYIKDINTIIKKLNYKSLWLQFNSLYSQEYESLELNDSVSVTFSFLDSNSPKQTSKCIFYSTEKLTYKNISYQSDLYLPQFISCSSQLQFLKQFSSVLLTSSLTQDISSFSHIIRLMISNSTINIKWLPKSLSFLSIYHCKCSISFVDFSYLPSLTHLFIDDFNCTGMKFLPKMKYLSIKNCLSLLSFPSLISFDNLKELVFENNKKSIHLIKPSQID